MKTMINTDLNEKEREEHRKLMLDAKKASRKRKADVKKSLKKKKRDYITADYVDEFLKVCPTLDSDIGHVLAGAEMVLLAVGGDENIHPSRQQFVASVFKEILIRYYELESKSMRKERIEGRDKRREKMAATMSEAMSEVLDELVKRKKEEEQQKKEDSGAKKEERNGDPMYG